MFVCTKEFIDCISEHNESSKSKQDFIGKLLKRVEGDNIVFLQISDLHIKPHDEESDLGTLKKVYTNTLKKYVNDWKKTFSVDSRNTSVDVQNIFDGVIVSGDIIDAEETAKCCDNEINKIKYSNNKHEAIKTYHRNAVGYIKVAISQFPGDLDDSVLIAPGNHDIARDAPRGAKGKSASFQNAIDCYDKTGKIIPNSYTKDTQAECARLILLGDNEGVVAVFAMDSNHVQYIKPEGSHDQTVYDRCGLVAPKQLISIQETIEKLSVLFDDRPLYVWIVLHHHLLPIKKYSDLSTGKIDELIHNVCLDSRDQIEIFKANRASLVTHGHMHSAVIQRASYDNLKDIILPSQGENGISGGLTIIGCPSFSDDVRNNYNGIMVVTIKKSRGLAQIDLLTKNARDGNDRPNHRVIIPLVSASRCSAAERRLYNSMQQWLKNDYRNQFDCNPDANDKDIDAYIGAVNKEWIRSGYTQLCSFWNEENTNLVIDFPLKQPPYNILTKNYRMLLMLMVSKGKIYILLNNHNPIRKAEYGDWDAPLMPTFTNISEFLQRLGQDILRQLDNSIQRSNTAKQFEKSCKIINDTLHKLQTVDAIGLQNELVELDTRDFIKFSATDAKPTLYTYKLTTLERLSLMDTHNDSLAGILETVPVLNEGHYVFRWDGFEKGNRAAAYVPPGYVWFPLEDWHEYSSIRTRNSDVMHWVGSKIQQFKKNNGNKVPDWLLWNESNDYKLAFYGIDRIETRPVKDQEDLSSQNSEFSIPASLEIGLRSVQLIKHQFRKEIWVRPYENSKIEMVYLQIEPRKPSVDEPFRVKVFDLSGFPLGYLRPVQRYVLKAGLERARTLRKKIQEKISIDVKKLGKDGENGYLLLKISGREKPIAFLPPVLESITNEKEKEDHNNEEFIVCDGNHRVVEYLLNSVDDEPSLNCVLVRNPNWPYYAYPSSSWDWWVTKENVLASSPDLYGKYTPRMAPDEVLNHKGEDEKENRREAFRQNGYRLYFRDFGTAFPDMGSQGGKAGV